MAREKRKAVVEKAKDPVSKIRTSSTETSSYSSEMDRKFVSNSKTKNAQTKVACELTCVPVAVATLRGHSAGA